MPPKTSTYVERYDGRPKEMYLLIGDDDLLEKYNTTWVKAIADIKKEFECKSVYDEKFLETKAKFNRDGITNFCDKKSLRWILIILYSSNCLGLWSKTKR